MVISFVGQCSNGRTCKICNMKHYALLHIDIHQMSNEKQTTIDTDSDNQEKTEVSTNILTHHGTVQTTSIHTVLLSTALIHIHRNNGQTEICHALLDSASESHFISSALVNRLQLKRKKNNVVVGDVSTSITSVKEETFFDISSSIKSKRYKLAALIIPKITADLPTAKVDISE